MAEQADDSLYGVMKEQAISTTTHYAVLGLAEDATYTQIRCNYLSCLLVVHPDKQQQEAEEASRFLRLQEAWDVLRDPQSRSCYDRHLASTRLRLATSVSEDVYLEDMSKDSDDTEFGASAYVYPCRCGDFFAVSLQELNELGFSRTPMKLGSFTNAASKDPVDEQAHSACLWDSNISNQQAYSACLRGNDILNEGSVRHEQPPRSLLLPCGSCSLQIRVLF